VMLLQLRPPGKTGFFGGLAAATFTSSDVRIGLSITASAGITASRLRLGLGAGGRLLICALS